VCRRALDEDVSESEAIIPAAGNSPRANNPAEGFGRRLRLAN